jgi:hypothetical protein
MGLHRREPLGAGCLVGVEKRLVAANQFGGAVPRAGGIRGLDRSAS